jgi:hypothetical protein
VKPIKRWLFAAALFFPVVHAANAATLSVNSDKTTYNIGETITLSVIADDQGATAYYIFGRLLYNGALVDNGTRSQVAMVGPTGNWTKNTLEQADSGSAIGTSSEAFDQARAFAESPTNLPGTLSTSSGTPWPLRVQLLRPHGRTPARRSRSCPSPRQLCCSASAWSC